MNGLNKIASTAVIMNKNNIDTDQIIPARFLKTIDKQGLGSNLFADWRYDEHGKPHEDFVLNQPEAKASRILLTGENFGCGSSREHAPWALKAFGFNAIIAISFADIFKINAVKNGLLPIQVPRTMHETIVETLEEIEKGEIKINLAKQTILLPTGLQFDFDIDNFSKKILMDGTDELDYLLTFRDEIIAFENEKAAGGNHAR